MSSVNKVILVGNVGKDPEIRVTQGGMKIANFSIATSEKRKGEEQTEWHRLIAFDKTAEVVEKYISKGSKLYVEGRIQTRKWEDKDGVERWSTEILVDRLVMVASKPVEQKAGSDDIPFDDEIPF